MPTRRWPEQTGLSAAAKGSSVRNGPGRGGGHHGHGHGHGGDTTSVDGGGHTTGGEETAAASVVMLAGGPQTRALSLRVSGTGFAVPRVYTDPRLSKHADSSPPPDSPTRLRSRPAAGWRRSPVRQR